MIFDYSEYIAKEQSGVDLAEVERLAGKFVAAKRRFEAAPTGTDERRRAERLLEHWEECLIHAMGHAHLEAVVTGAYKVSIKPTVSGGPWREEILRMAGEGTLSDDRFRRIKFLVRVDKIR